MLEDIGQQLDAGGPAVTFEIDAAVNSKQVQKWIDEAIASGPVTPLREKEMDAIQEKLLAIFDLWEYLKKSELV